MNVNRITSQDYVRKALEQAFYRQNQSVHTPDFMRDCFQFCSNPDEYDWKYLGKKEMLVPYSCEAASLYSGDEIMPGSLSKLGKIRWEKHRVWIAEGTLRRGESNVLARRCFYLDEESWAILLGEGYDHAGFMTKYFVFFKEASNTSWKHGRWYGTENSGTNKM